MRTSKSLRTRIDSLLEEIDALHPAEWDDPGDIDRDLQQALAYLQTRHCPIHYSDGLRAPIDIWNPGHLLPISVRRAVRKYREHIVERMAAGDVAVCPTTWHEKYHRYDHDQERWICDMCHRLEPSVNHSHHVVMTKG